MLTPMNFWYYELSSPLGPLTAAFDAKGYLRELKFGGLDPRKTTPLAPKEQREAKTFLVKQLEAFWGGNLRTFTVPIKTEGTPFQEKAWDQLLRIPYGTTISYLEQATRLGDPQATRAVASANNANPIAILIPCHRVIGADGSLTGYGGGVDKKAFLLNLERGLPPSLQPDLGLGD
jgi:methylated-DNA-[protein]-cysteine S-methyltransferase